VPHRTAKRTSEGYAAPGVGCLGGRPDGAVVLNRVVLSFRWHLAAFPGARRVRGLATSGSGLTAYRRLVGIEGLLVLTLFGLRPDLDEQHHDDTGPQCPAERVEQVG
jgi:hypothetical protein